MPITVLLAEDAEPIRTAIKRILKTEPAIELVGEAASFAQTFKMCAELGPTVVLLDLHMPDEKDFRPELVKSYLLAAKCILGISIWNDAEAKALAISYGATTLLDKINLGSELIPAIMAACSDSIQS